MTLSIAFGAAAASLSPVRRSAAEASPDETAQGGLDPQQDETPSVTVTLSQYARDRMAAMNQAIRTLSAQNAQAGEQRKAAARARIDDIRQRIELLKKLAVGLGPKAAKALLAQIRQLAHELGQAAGELKGNGSTEAGNVVGIGAARGDAGGQASPASASPGATTETPDEAGAGQGGSLDAAPETVEAAPEPSADPADASSPDADETAAAAPEASAKAGASAEAEVSRALDEAQASPGLKGAAAFGAPSQNDQDSARIRDAVRGLRQLLALVKAQLQHDERNRRTLREVEARLRDSEQAARDIQAAPAASASVSTAAISTAAISTPDAAVSSAVAATPALPAGGLSISV